MTVGVPLAAFAIFLALWSFAASRIQTPWAQRPAPPRRPSRPSTWCMSICGRERRDAFYARQEQRRTREGRPRYQPRIHPLTGKAAYIDQIFTSLKTCSWASLLATLVAVPRASWRHMSRWCRRLST